MPTVTTCCSCIPGSRPIISKTQIARMVEAEMGTASTHTSQVSETITIQVPLTISSNSIIQTILATI